MLCSAGLFAVFSSTISKSPVLPLFASHLGADPAGVGTVAAVSAFTGVVASVPAGMLSDRIGRKRMLIISAVIFASAPFLYQFASTLWHLAVIRFYHGFATAIFVPVAMALVSDLFHGERGEKMGWFSTSTLLGRFMAPIIGGVIIGSLAFNPGLGYRVVYLVCGVAGIIAFFLTLKLPDPGNDHGKGQSWKETFTILRGVMSNRVIVLTSAVEASILFAYGTFETFLPLYAVRNGISAYEVGLFLSSQVITLALTKPVMGRFSDRHGRRPQIVAGAVVGACCIGSFSLFTSFFPLLALSVLFGLSLSVVTSATSAFIADQSGRESHGSAMGMLGSVMDIGHTTGPFVSGMVAGYLGFGASFLGASLILVIVSLIFLITIGIKDKGL
ncbi:MAG TPA: MFS transporter [Dissulfurispiraceae bacterium]|nr:MFS transporter [Dissulfurispiraceae bacterium]